jgi:hypothetical protein
MGYGGSTFSGTLNVDLVEADVSAIVSGICGYYGSTLSDLATQLGVISGNLFDFTYYRSIADVLVSIEQAVWGIRYQTDRLQFNWDGRLFVST